MNQAQWRAFSTFRTEFKIKADEWNAGYAAVLQPLQRAAALRDTPDYPLETAVVYNRALDEVTESDEIRLIVIGDNPGKDEQLSKNNKYLVGQSGKIAEGFFRRSPELHTDFRRNVIILNKTPVHTAKTAHLRAVCREGGTEIEQLVLQSQLWMAQKTAALHQALCAASDGTVPAPELWLVGYAELKGKGIFLPYRDELRKSYLPVTGGVPAQLMNTLRTAAWKRVFVYQHFSMNRFLIDLNDYRAGHPELTLDAALHELGTKHRTEIFG